MLRFEFAAPWPFKEALDRKASAVEVGYRSILSCTTTARYDRAVKYGNLLSFPIPTRDEYRRNQINRLRMGSAWQQELAFSRERLWLSS
jgi:hypothetical protein